MKTLLLIKVAFFKFWFYNKMIFKLLQRKKAYYM